MNERGSRPLIECLTYDKKTCKSGYFDVYCIYKMSDKPLK